MAPGGTSWHPARAVLEAIELVLDGALVELPDIVACTPGRLPPAGWTDLAGWPALADLTIEDAEGTPVAVVTPDGRLSPALPFTHPPLRSHRRKPAEVRAELSAAGGSQVIGVPVIGASVANFPAADAVAEAVDRAKQTGARMLWLAVVGAGRDAPGGLSPEASLRAVQQVAAEAVRAGVSGVVVPVAIPVQAGPPTVDRAVSDRATVHRGVSDSDVDSDLIAAVASGYGADLVTTIAPAGPGHDAHPAFLHEVALAHRPAHRRGVTVFLTGLSGSGKSTIAKRFTERLLEDGRRTVTLLDGDEVRRLLSQGLGFSRADRDLNIRRIGFVAAEVTRHGGVAVCAPIAPFADVRAQLRADVEAVGDLLLVHVATPLEECELRDRKGLYAKARRGELADFTGVSSPYQPPDDADLRIDTTGQTVESCVELLWQLFAGRGYLSEGA